ncbi:deoxyribodipyrimidine photo-lyase [uncultured Endozoicomonas sp.]|uniref:cryptochrome/photolyase family protein n=1 Tax=uncultured Endozoicomonas sp. TaxID=432652 RepID=UPI00262DFACD|nr:deoxyribodipyrimidine photo-lyase [uncultured Endozoicomonas sp.]
MLTIHWFRQDLRLSDNPSLYEAARSGQVLPVYILDDISPGKWKMGAASRWWLHHSLEKLNKSLKGRLLILVGDAKEVLPKIVSEYNADAVYWNRCYEPWRIQRDQKIKERLRASGIDVKSFNGSLLWEPWNILKKDSTPYKVFTPYYRRGCLNAPAPREPLSTPKPLRLFSDASGLPLDQLNLLPTTSWDQPMGQHWLQEGCGIGELAARDKLQVFLETGLNGYQEGRNYPSLKKVSNLSAHLHFGETSPNQVWFASAAGASGGNVEADLDCFHSELGWREFSYYLLFHFPTLPEKNFQSKFDHFPWRKAAKSIAQWQKGQTGFPIVDAGMRELWQTGVMHNRVRMVVGSFLVKNLLQHWHHGEQWFWDCLVDADLASNSASWQWVAGSGADAAPYFRIFNPVSQGQKFDASGEYIRKYVPEIAGLPDKYLFAPWEAPEMVLAEAGVQLGKHYPEPIVDIKQSRLTALDAWGGIRS